MTDQLRFWPPEPPQIGEIRKSRSIGYKRDDLNYIWHACEVCGKPRWVRYVNGQPARRKCQACATKTEKKGHVTAEENPNWRGGRNQNSDGYISVRVYPDDFFYPMAGCNGYVREHRLVMAKHLGRCLQPWEHVHHKNGIKDDNRIENLGLTTVGSHSREHGKGYRDGYQKGLIDGRTKQIEELRQEIRLLRWQIKESKEANL